MQTIQVRPLAKCDWQSLNTLTEDLWEMVAQPDLAQKHDLGLYAPCESGGQGTNWHQLAHVTHLPEAQCLAPRLRSPWSPEQSALQYAHLSAADCTAGQTFSQPA